jgi:hypothetical protein
MWDLSLVALGRQVWTVVILVENLKIVLCVWVYFDQSFLLDLNVRVWNPT